MSNTPVMDNFKKPAVPVTAKEETEPVAPPAEDSVPEAPSKSKIQNDKVSDKVTKFILSFLTKSEGKKARSKDIGRTALHTAGVVRKPLAEDEEKKETYYTAWAGVPCTKLVNIGLIKKVMVSNPVVGTGRGNARKELVYYAVTDQGEAWLKKATTAETKPAKATKKVATADTPAPAAAATN